MIQIPFRWLGPARTTFFLSLLLSALAVNTATIDRDGILYVHTAQAFLEGGFSQAHASFNWPFLPIFMALAAKLTGLDLVQAGYLLNALFMAGTCALMVASVQGGHEKLGWWAALVVLAIPGFNEYRDGLTREYGAWFFIMLSFWLAIIWESRLNVWRALLVQFALGMAALFRPEAVAFFPALIAWQFFSSPYPGGQWRALFLASLPLLGTAFLVALYFGKFSESANQIFARLLSDIGRISTDRFNAKADVLASGIIEYSRHNAATILFWGSLALIPIKFITKLKLLFIPLLFLRFDTETRQQLKPFALFFWSLLAHLIVLSIFVLDLQFIAGRYIGPMLLFSTPFIAFGLHSVLQFRQKWQKPAILLLALMSIANVHVLSTPKTHFKEAGLWLKQHIASPEKVYINSSRSAFHADWHKIPVDIRNNQQAIAEAAATGRFEYYVIELSNDDPPPEPWISKADLQLIQEFKHGSGSRIIILQPRILLQGQGYQVPAQ